MTRPLIIDCFAGGGGASTGIEMALGRSPDYAINHDPVAVAMHAVNHPDSVHLCQNVYQVDPLDHFNRAHIGFAWFSPDCKHFSKAKGGAPVQRNIRDLAWIIPGWIERIQGSGGKVDVVAIENVEEFQTWGPLIITDKGLMPDPERKGETFKAWCKKLRRLGGKIEIKELRACDYGAPTIRKRVFILIRFDGQKIIWPEPTHGDPKSEAVQAGRLKPWLTAGHDVIDWDIVCPSIFDTRSMILERYGLRAVRPLADNTMARVARGIKRYVLDVARPFLVNLTHGARLEDVDDPLRTVTCANRGEKAVVVPVMTYAQQGGSVRSPSEPLHTVTASAKDVNGVIAPVLAAYYGEGNGGVDRSADPASPLQTVVTENRHAVIAPVLAGCGGRAGQSRPRGADEPMATVTAKADTCVAAAHLMTMRNAGKPFQGADEPAHTVTAGGAGLTCMAGYMAQHNGNGVIGRAADQPLSTATQAGSQQQVVAASMLSMKGSDRRASGADEPARVACTGGGQSAVVAAHVTRQFSHSTGHAADDPTGSITAKGKTGVVAGALVKYYGTGDGQAAGDPLHTVTVKDRFCLAQAAMAAPPFGPEHHARAREVAAFLRSYGFWDEREFVTLDVATDFGVMTLVMVDIGMRMLIPRELFNAQGFPRGYRIDRDLDGNVFTQSDQVGRAGNSVCPPVAAAITAANVPHLAEFAEAAE